MNEQVLMFYPLGKNSEKPKGGGTSTTTPPPVRPRVNVTELLRNIFEFFG